MLNINSDQVALQKNILMDRIEIYRANSKGKRLTAVFRTAKGTAVLYAAVSHLNLNDLHKAITNKELRPYSKQSLKNKLVYVPESSTSVKAVVAYYESIRFNEFIPILFNDPDNVFLSKGKTAYSDGSSQLEKTGNIMQYVNPGSDDNNTQAVKMSFCTAMILSTILKGGRMISFLTICLYRTTLSALTSSFG
ncbi:two-component system activity regulator YycH [Terrilactibacillus sp. S3-3]|nr:two-component system activity regulator YycH [Terrilactibacillus sp. S3-3]